jgi:hypothetical protein
VNEASNSKKSEKVRLKAVDAEDLAVIAAFLQDSTTTLKEMVFEPENRRFAGIFERFRRERQKDWDSCDGLTVCLSALLIEQVDEVKHRGLDPDDLDKKLTLLTIATEPGRDKLIHIDLVFEGGGEIQLRTDTIAAQLDDFGEPATPASTPCDHFRAIIEGQDAPS